MRKKLVPFVFLCLVGLGVFVRVYRVTTIPPYHADELAFGYSAYSLGKVGMDEFGQKFPLLLESFGDYKMALNGYLLLPVIKVFGLEEWVLRLPAVILGLLSVIMVYFLVKEFLGDKRLALVSSLLLLFSPWHIIFSRTANEAVLQVFLIISFFVFWLRYLKKGQTRKAVLAVIFLVLAMIAYYSSLVFLPIITLLLAILIEPSKTGWLKRFTPFMAVLIVSMFLLLTQPLDRIKQTTFLNSDELKAAVAENYLEEGSGKNTLLVRLFNNKYYLGTLFLARNYFYHLNFDFLFLRGDRNYSRYSIPYTGPLYLWELPFLATGLYLVIYRWLIKKDNRYLFVLGWFLTGFLASAIAFWDLNTQRALVTIPSVQIIVSLGVLGVFTWIIRLRKIWKVVLLTIIAGLMVYNFVLFLDRYFIHQLVREPWRRDGYTKEMVAILNELGPKYQKVVLSKTPVQSFFFYNKTDPWEAQKILETREKDTLNFIHVAGFANYLFMPSDCPWRGKLGVLYVCSGETVAQNTKILRVIRYPTGQPARIFLVFLDPWSKIEHSEERIKIFPETVASPQIIPAESDKYW